MEELIKHYIDLLIIQYKTKMKARATIEAFVRTLFADDNDDILLLKIQNAYDLDTAQETQLKTLAKYIGYDDSLNIINTNYFKLSDTEGADVTPGLSDTEGQYSGYPLLTYSGYTYNELSIIGSVGIDEFRRILNFLSEMKNNVLSLGNIDALLDKYFGGLIYIEEGKKQIIYHIAADYLPFLDTDSKLKMFFQKYFPKPMGCSLQVIRNPFYLNLISYGGAESGVDENFIYTGTADDISKYFEMPYDIDIKSSDTVEIGIKVKINGDYELSGFYQIKDSPQLSVLKRRIDGTITATGYGYTFPLCEYADLVDEWITITLKNKQDYGGFVGTVKMGDEIIAENVLVPIRYDFTGRFQFAIANIGQISYYGFIGQMDFKECYIKKNNEYIWKGLTSIKPKGV